MLSLKGTIVTADALNCQREIDRTIVDKRRASNRPFRLSLATRLGHGTGDQDTVRAAGRAWGRYASFRASRTSPAPWDAFADVEMFVDEALEELEATAKDVAGTDAIGAKAAAVWSDATQGRYGDLGLFVSVPCNGGRSDLTEDGRKIHDMHLFRVKAPASSKGDWDLYDLVRTTPGEQAFRPLSAGLCPLVRT
jgi:hypothetical protein